MTPTHSFHEPPDDVEESLDRALVEISQPSEVSHAAMRSVHSELAINDILPGLSLNEPTAILLDINNLYKRAKSNNFRIDYNRLKIIFEQRCDLRLCVAFSAVDRNNPEANDWVKYMDKIGYTLRNRDLLQYTGDDGRMVSKGNMDVEITIAAMKLSPAFTHVIIGSCDGDYIPLVKELQTDDARRVSVLGISGYNWAGMSRALAKEADNFYDLFRLQEQVNYRGER